MNDSTPAPFSPRILRLSDCTIDLRSRRVQRDGQSTSLTTREADLLQRLAREPGAVISRQALLVEVWGYHPLSQSRAIDKTVNRLRAKIETNPHDPIHLQTVHGEGYRLVPAEQDTPDRDQPLVLPTRATPGNLRAPVEALFGRKDTLLELHQAVASGSRLITLTGVAGSGKSALARHLASQWRPPSGGVWFVPMDGVRGIAQAALTVAAHLGLSADDAEGTDGSSLKAMRALARRITANGAVVLVLDGLDTLADDAAALVECWLGASADLRVLATVRHRLGIPGERWMGVEPLSPDAAIRLLMERAQLGGGAPPEALDRVVLTRIVERLDRLPLAIELTAARLAQTAPHALPDTLSLVEQAPHGTPSHPSDTITAALDQTWDTLAPPLRSAVVQCAVFSDGFTSAAAEAVLDVGDCPVRLVLSALLDAALLTLIPPRGASLARRYRLAPSVQSWSESKATSPDLQQAWLSATGRHARYYTHLGRVTSHGLPQAERLEGERANLSAARQRVRQAESATQHTTTRPRSTRNQRVSSGRRGTGRAQPERVTTSPSPPVLGREAQGSLGRDGRATLAAWPRGPISPRDAISTGPR